MLAENKVLSAKKPFTTKSFNFQPYSADHIHEHETNWEDIRKPITNDFSLTVKLFDNAIRTALKITEEAVFETAFDECGRFKFTLKEVQRHGKVTAIIKIESASEDEIHGDNNLKFNINDYIYIFTYKFVKNKRRRENIAVGYITGITKAEIRIGLFKEAVDNKTKAKVLEEFCHEMVGLSLKVNYSMYNSQLQSLEVLKAHRFVQEKLGYAMHDFSSHQRNDNANDTDLERAFKAMTRKTYSTFVLTGPPGTGKTTVMIEAILELVKQKKRVLIATKSNAAADTFTNRFLQHFNDAKRVFRLMSERHEPSQYNDNIKRISGIFFNKNTNLWDYKLVLTKTNDGKKLLCLPPNVDNYEVVIATLGVSFPLDQISMNTFSHIFIEDAHEAPELFIWEFLAVHCKENKTRLILCGDTTLLRYDYFLEPLNIPNSVLKQSLLERLVRNEQFKINSRLMIRLSKNYRSHESIIDAIGAMFDDPIVAAETFNDTLDLTSITSHPSNRVIFQNVLTDDEELDVIYEYLEKCEKLFQYVDIGIITPYKSQAVIIQQHVDERLGIVVNVVDEFHGIERHAIIISCTLDYDKVIGQNKDTEWLNMAISRAKSLVIIVGRASYLEKLPEGRRFMAFCHSKLG